MLYIAEDEKQLFKRSELPTVHAIWQAIRDRNSAGLERLRHLDGELTLSLIDWAVRQAYELSDEKTLGWCRMQDATLREREGGRQEFADAYSARLAWRAGLLRPIVGAGYPNPPDFRDGEISSSRYFPRPQRWRQTANRGNRYKPRRLHSPVQHQNL